MLLVCQSAHLSKAATLSRSLGFSALASLPWLSALHASLKQGPKAGMSHLFCRCSILQSKALASPLWPLKALPSLECPLDACPVSTACLLHTHVCVKCVCARLERTPTLLLKHV